MEGIMGGKCKVGGIKEGRYCTCELELIWMNVGYGKIISLKLTEDSFVILIRCIIMKECGGTPRSVRARGTLILLAASPQWINYHTHLLAALISSIFVSSCLRRINVISISNRLANQRDVNDVDHRNLAVERIQYDSF